MAGGPVEGRRRIPSVDAILRSPGAASLIEAHGQALVAAAVRETLARIRECPSGQEEDEGASFAEALRRQVAEAVARRTTSSLRRVINATGVIVHTNLGRARLSDTACARAALAAGSFTTLEYDLEGGERGSRSVHVERPLASLFPGQASLVVNNNAAAVFLALGVLARDREVIISRGELVEIGGSFRIPDVLTRSGAKLREVGTTNRTRLADYATAITPSTGMILKVHPSNYRIIGFTEQVDVGPLAELAAGHGLPLVVDQGSGCLESLEPAGIPGEPTVASLLSQGASLVTFSGDKILGGPQAGVAVGRPDLIDRMRRDPLYRVLRLDKISLAALEATLDAWARGFHRDQIPVQRMIFAPVAQIAGRAESLARRMGERLAGRCDVLTMNGTSRVGGGAAPEQGLPTVLIGLRPLREVGGSVAAWEAKLREFDPPVIARVHEDTLVFDLRTVDPGEEEELLEAAAASV